MLLRVGQPGLLTTVQDEGRVGVYHLGMPPAGAMDRFAYRVANLLVGNPDGAAVLELTYMGPTLELTEDAVVAVTGADLPMSCDGEPLEPWASHAVKAGSTLSFGFVRSGARAYLAVAGGIDVPLVMGSRSTYTLCGIGGFEGRGLAAGDEVRVADGVRGTPGRRVPDALVPTYPDEAELRVVVGLASYRVEPESLRAFFDTTWTITPDANRVGYRYRGIELEFVPRTPPHGAGSAPSNVTDIGYPIGSIQVPGGTEPIALLHDAVTGGGYATIATIISADLARAGQSKTNETTRFVEVTLDEALAARHELEAALSRVRDHVGGAA
jgi:biotin-dependent carboxylase-like uncharacterized protein